LTLASTPIDTQVSVTTQSAAATGLFRVGRHGDLGPLAARPVEEKKKKTAWSGGNASGKQGGA